MAPKMTHDANDADEQILGHLTRGRNLPQNLADKTGYSRQYIQNRLQMLKAADYATNLGGGLYEITDAGRQEIGADGDRDDLRDGKHEWKNRWHNTHQELKVCQEERDQLREELGDAREATADVDVARLERALDTIEAAAERGDGDTLRNALENAREEVADE